MSSGINVVTQLIKIPTTYTLSLNSLYISADKATKQMLTDRTKYSSKDYPYIPCVIAKGLIRKYQHNKRCQSVTHLVLPICGDKGKQVKLVSEGFRIPAVFGKSVIPVKWRYPIDGYIRQVELSRRSGEWFASVSYRTIGMKPIQVFGCLGIDRNSVGNIAVMADLQNGYVEHLGFNPARTKEVWRNRKRNLQKSKKNRLLSKIRKKQGRRTKLENHIVSKRIVNYATSHCLAIALESIKGINSKGSKIRRYSESNQWSFYQLETFIRYKAALCGIPIISVPAEYTSQECSRCGKIQKPNGKLYHCGVCGHIDHRDANAGFNIAKRGNFILNGGKVQDSVSQHRGLLVAPYLGSVYA